MHSLRAQTVLILRHDLRLFWRDLAASKLSSVVSAGGVVILVEVIFHVIAIALFHFFGRPSLIAETAAWSFVTFAMLGAAMNQAVTVLFERADFDLLVSSPIAAPAILLARMFGMVIATAVSIGFFFLPVLNGAIFGGSVRYLAGYLAWALLAGLATSCGIWLTLLLVRMLGARRARVWTQVLAAVLGASVYLIFQIQNTLSPESQAAMAGTLHRIFGQPPLTYLSAAGRGDPLALLGLAVLAIGTLVITARVLGHMFVSGLQDAAVVKPRAHRHRDVRFTDRLFWATFRKDARLIVRDPLLLSRTLPSIAYVVPLLLPLIRNGHAGAAGLLGSFAVFASVTLSSQLAGVAAAGEEGWDLIRMSPASTLHLRFAKIAAGMAVPFAMVVALVVAMAFLGRPGLALFAGATAAVSCVGSCWIEVAVIKPTPRKDLIQRPNARRQSITALSIASAIVFMLASTGAVALASYGKWLWAFLDLLFVSLVAVGSLTLVKPRDIELEAAGAAANRP